MPQSRWRNSRIGLCGDQVVRDPSTAMPFASRIASPLRMTTQYRSDQPSAQAAKKVFAFGSSLVENLRLVGMFERDFL